MRGLQIARRTSRVSGQVRLGLARVIGRSTVLSARPYSSQSSLPPSPGGPSNPSSAPSNASNSRPRRMGLLEQYAPRLHAVSARTGVPIPTLGVSFLILHEITAVLPVVLLFWIFQALGAGASLVAWLADETDQSTEAPRGSWDWRAIAHGWVVEGEKKAEGVGRRYGILGYEKRVKGEPAGQSSEGEPVVSPKQEGVRAEEVTTMDDPAARVARKAKEGGAAAGLANAIAAYVVVKALLPVRIGISLAAAPSFARSFLEPVRRYGNSYKR